MKQEESLSGFRLLGQHILAVWLKLSLVWMRSWGMVLLQILVPVLQMTATLGIMEYVFGLTSTIHRRALSLADGYANKTSYYKNTTFRLRFYSTHIEFNILIVLVKPKSGVCIFVRLLLFDLSV